MQTARPTANVPLDEIFGVPCLISDPRYQAASKAIIGTEPSLHGAAAATGQGKQPAAVDDVPAPLLAATAEEYDADTPLLAAKDVPLADSGYALGDLRPDSAASTLLDQPHCIPTDLREEDYVGYPHLETREWQLAGHPLLSQKEDAEGGPAVSLDMSDSARQWRLDNNALPRFLFRGYSQRSGGGDHRLNQWDKIIPHAFLDAPTAIPPCALSEWPRRDEVIEAHLTGNLDVDAAVRQSPCSSWSQSPQVALRYAGGPDDGSSRLAILDTTRLRPWNAIYNVAELRYLGYHRLPLRWGSWEYLAYGPLEGSCLYTFPRQNLADLWRPDFSYSGNRSLSLGPGVGPDILRSARAVATLFARRVGWEAERPSIVISVVVLLLASWRHSHMNPPERLRAATWDAADLQAIADELAPEIAQFTTWRPCGLAGPNSERVSMGYEWFCQALRLMKAIDTTPRWQ
ncbi:hypothetical protein PG991_014028 [Apiospora marii]|uniref:Uncharacterized protein n=1 Tax=Apiospora marii TaxID=335849 RepID=A0ABR1R7M7_9PEZI